MKTAIVSLSDLRSSKKFFGGRSLLASDYVEWPDMPPEVAEEVGRLKKQRKYALTRAKKLLKKEQRIRGEYERGFTIIELIFAISILVSLLLLAVWQFSSGPAEFPKEAAADVLPGPVRIICVEGHEYVFAQYTWSGFTRAVMSPRFNEEGKPSKCRAEKH